MITTNDINITEPTAVPGGWIFVARIDKEDYHAYRAFAYATDKHVFLHDTDGHGEFHASVHQPTEILALQMLQSFLFAAYEQMPMDPGFVYAPHIPPSFKDWYDNALEETL